MKIRLSPDVRLLRPSRVEIVQGRLVWLDAGVDVWEKNGELFFVRQEPVTTWESMTDEFVRLKNASDLEIAAFCQRYGGLKCCERHSWPLGPLRTEWGGVRESELSGLLTNEVIAEHAKCRPATLRGYKAAHVERFEHWRALAAYFESLRLLIHLVRSEEATKQDWAGLNHYPYSPCFLSSREAPWTWSIEKQCARLAKFAHFFMLMYDVRPAMTYEKSLWNIEINPWSTSILTRLCLELAQQMVSPDEIKGVCAVCGRSILTGRVRPRTRNQYCESADCIRAGWRRAKMNPVKRWKNPRRGELNRKAKS